VLLVVAAVVEQGDRAGGVAAQMDGLDGDDADGDAVAVLDRAVHRDRQAGSVQWVGQHLRARHGGHLLQALPVVAVLVGGDDGADRLVGHQGEQAVGLGRGVDEHPVARLGAAQQVGVVVVRADRELVDLQAGQLSHVGGAADLNVACVGHG
jgi:hypothetical protein